MTRKVEERWNKKPDRIACSLIVVIEVEKDNQEKTQAARKTRTQTTERTTIVTMTKREV